LRACVCVRVGLLLRTCAWLARMRASVHVSACAAVPAYVRRTHLQVCNCALCGDIFSINEQSQCGTYTPHREPFTCRPVLPIRATHVVGAQAMLCYIVLVIYYVDMVDGRGVVAQRQHAARRVQWVDQFFAIVDRVLRMDVANGTCTHGSNATGGRECLSAGTRASKHTCTAQV
jgi:hypothetical protein